MDRWERVASESGRPQSPSHSASGNKCCLAPGPPVSRISCLGASRRLLHSQLRRGPCRHGNVEEPNLNHTGPGQASHPCRSNLSWIPRLLHWSMFFIHKELNSKNTNQETTFGMATIIWKGKWRFITRCGHFIFLWMSTFEMLIGLLALEGINGLHCSSCFFCFF